MRTNKKDIIKLFTSMKDENMKNSCTEYRKGLNKKINDIIKLTKELPDELDNYEGVRGVDNKTALDIIGLLIKSIEDGSSFVREIEIETITDLVYNTRYDTRERIMKINYRRE